MRFRKMKCPRHPRRLPSTYNRYGRLIETLRLLHESFEDFEFFPNRMFCHRRRNAPEFGKKIENLLFQILAMPKKTCEKDISMGTLVKYTQTLGWGRQRLRVTRGTQHASGRDVNSELPLRATGQQRRKTKPSCAAKEGD